MKKILLLFLLVCNYSFSQKMKGQAIFLEPQRQELLNRFNANLGKYISTNYNDLGFFGDVNLIVLGAETFLNEEQASGYLNRWTWMSTEIPIPDYASGAYESEPNSSPCGSGSFCVDYIHYAALLSWIWRYDTNLTTFSGETKSRAQHSQDLAESVWDVLVQQHNEPTLDFADTTRWVRNGADGNPHFMSISKMSKYLTSYSFIHKQIGLYSSFTSNWQSVEDWFLAAKDFAYARATIRHNSIFGAIDPDNFTYPSTNAYTTGDSTHAYFDALGIGFMEVSNAQASGLNNRYLDFVSYVGNYGVLMGDSAAQDFEFKIFKHYLEIAIFADGTNNEHYRAKGDNTALGLHYVILSTFHIVSAAHRHYVAALKGFEGVLDAGKYYDYTTSIGTDERYTSYPSTSTSGGNKDIRLMLENLSKYYRASSDGGFKDLRYEKNSIPIESQKRPFTIIAAIANLYYKDNDLKNYYLMNQNEGYSPMGYFGNGSALNAGSWGEHSVGVSWGEAGIFGGFAGVAEMEDYFFSTNETLIQHNLILSRRRF